jgi:chromosome segregation ATPase
VRRSDPRGALEVAQLEEMRCGLCERIDDSCQRQRQLENERRKLTRLKQHSARRRRRYIATSSQRSTGSMNCKKAQIRELVRQLHENEELNRSKLQEKEQLIHEINGRMSVKTEIPRKKKQERTVISSGTVNMQADIEQLQAAKLELMRKMQDLQRKAASNERKLEAVKSKLERKVTESEKQVRKMRANQE